MRDYLLSFNKIYSSSILTDSFPFCFISTVTPTAMPTEQTHNVVHEANGVKLRRNPKEFFERQPNKGHIHDVNQYKQMYEQSIKDPQGFFGPLAKELLSWDHDFTLSNQVL